MQAKSTPSTIHTIHAQSFLRWSKTEETFEACHAKSMMWAGKLAQKWTTHIMITGPQYGGTPLASAPEASNRPGDSLDPPLPSTIGAAATSGFGQYAVMFAFGETTKSKQSVHRTWVCVLLANVKHTAKMLAASGMKDVKVIIVTPADYVLPNEEDFTSAGAVIVKSRIHTLWNASGTVDAAYGTSEKQRLMMLRFKSLCLPFKRVLYLDIDSFLTDIQSDSFWTTRPNDRCVISTGATSPASGSAWTITPSAKGCETMQTAMKGPWSRETGWQGVGHMPVWKTCRCPLERMHPFCKRLQMPFDKEDPKGMCKTETGKMPWSFYAANADQGLLYHYCGPSP